MKAKSTSEKSSNNLSPYEKFPNLYAKGYFSVPKTVDENPNLSPMDVWMFSQILNFATNDRITGLWFSIDRFIKRRLHNKVSRNTFKASIKRLEAEGYLTKNVRIGATNEMCINDIQVVPQQQPHAQNKTRTKRRTFNPEPPDSANNDPTTQSQSKPSHYEQKPSHYEQKAANNYPTTQSNAGRVAAKNDPTGQPNSDRGAAKIWPQSNTELPDTERSLYLKSSSYLKSIERNKARLLASVKDLHKLDDDD